MESKPQKWWNGGSTKWLVGLAFAMTLALGKMVHSGLQTQINQTVTTLTEISKQNSKIGLKIAGIESNRWTAQHQLEFQTKIDERLTILLEAVRQNQIAMAHLPPPELLQRVTESEQRIKALEK